MAGGGGVRTSAGCAGGRGDWHSRRSAKAAMHALGIVQREAGEFAYIRTSCWYPPLSYDLVGDCVVGRL